MRTGLLTFVSALLLTACAGALPGPTPTPTVSPTPVPPTPVPTPTLEPAADLVYGQAEIPPDQVLLIIVNEGFEDICEFTDPNCSCPVVEPPPSAYSFDGSILELSPYSLPGGEEGLPFDHEGRVFLEIALAGVQIEHPGDQGALQARPGSTQHVKTRAGDLDTLLEIDDTQGWA